MTSTDLSRRSVLSLIGAGAGAAAVGLTLRPSTAEAATTAGALACGEVTDESTIGPYFVDEGLVRSDMRAGQTGTALTMTISVTNATTCAPLVGAAVDIWHANAAGKYSDISSEGTTGQTWLRAIQLTDANGQVTFTTVVPGWYAGRTMHIHAKVRTGGTLSGTSYTGGTNVWIGQLFFAEAVSQAVAAVAPYSSSRTTRVLNTQDNIYQGADGASTTLAMTGSAGTSYAGSVAIGVAAGGTPVVQTTISGAVKRTTTLGQAVTMTGTAPAGEQVDLFYRFWGQTAYTAWTTVTANASGVWTASFTAIDSVAVFAEAAGDVSDVVTWLLGATITIANRLRVKRNGTATLTGTGVPGSTTQLWFRRKGTSGFTILRSRPTSAAGRWSFSFRVDTDYQYYARSAHGPLTSSNNLVLAV